MDYWTCSKFADRLRGTTSPTAATGKEWNEWTRNAKAAHPFRYWLADTALGKLQEIVKFPANTVHSVKYWLANRYTAKTHVLSSNLKKGQWHEFDTRLLHCTFDSLVDFVEIEQAAHYLMWMPKEERAQYKAPFHAFGFWRSYTWRSVEAGIACLTWQTNLTNIDWVSADHPDYGTPTHQAITAKETLDLYNWWKNIYPNRPDPYDASGWSTICDKQRQLNADDFFFDDENEEDKAISNNALVLTAQIEEQYEAEDTEMLIRLIRIRKSLWT